MASKNKNGIIEPEKENNAITEEVEQAPTSEATSNVENQNTDTKGAEATVGGTAPKDVKKDEPPVFEEKQGKRGVKLGTIAIIISLLFGGGLTFHMQQKNAEYQEKINALQSQLDQTETSSNKILKRHNKPQFLKQMKLLTEPKPY